jgi:multidrug resistance efflux pump
LKHREDEYRRRAAKLEQKEKQLKVLEEKLSSIQLELEAKAKQLEAKGNELMYREQMLNQNQSQEENQYSANDVTMLVSPFPDRTKLQETPRLATPNSSKYPNFI